MINQLQNIRNLISNNKIEAALDALTELSKQVSDTKLKNEIILNCANYRRNYRDNLLNLTENTIAGNKAILMILEFVDELEKDFATISNNGNFGENKIKSSFFNFVLKVGRLNLSIVFTLLLLVTFYVFRIDNIIESSHPDIPDIEVPEPQNHTTTPIKNTTKYPTTENAPILEGDKKSHTQKDSMKFVILTILIDSKYVNEEIRVNEKPADIIYSNVTIKKIRVNANKELIIKVGSCVKKFYVQEQNENVDVSCQ